ncbi:RNA 2',3'-cyclic phosphodiesterase [Modestobacter sp. L9-4]|uniref:RNA 2',3'-cyclic phosphodiesterase n=1 Tax=Modestobacter sp. L9-4 TaxID=2851567 RepID=UPI0021048363|nr:RNA 2',3'-cyclic phosphodiesterase [Modestobacter sp. L9-4]
MAVDPPPAAVSDLDRALAPLRAAPGAPHWTPPERWHLTLAFLGQVPAPLLAPLTAAVGAAVEGVTALSLQLTGAGRFGSRRRPAVCWAGLAGDVAPLTALAGRLADAARAVGLPVEDRPFRAHLTVGRWRAGQPADPDLPDRLAGHRGPAWTASEVVLWRSHLGAAPRYERVTAWPLEQPAASGPAAGA